MDNEMDIGIFSGHFISLQRDGSVATCMRRSILRNQSSDSQSYASTPHASPPTNGIPANLILTYKPKSAPILRIQTHTKLTAISNK
jgi:hypothetical protein